MPGHCRGCEEQYAVFAKDAASLGLPTEVGVADVSGPSSTSEADSYAALTARIPLPGAIA